MIPLPIQYLHLETGILPIFLAMVLWTQLARASEPGSYTQSGRTQLFFLIAGFFSLTAVFGAALLKVSPPLAVELAAGVTLSLMHPVNALCFFVHLLFLRPWEIVPDNLVLLSLPRFLGAVCLFSWLMYSGRRGKPSARTRRGLLLLASFSLWLFLSTFQTPRILESQAAYFATYFKSLVVFLMCLFFIDSERSVLEVNRTLVISALALIVIRIYQVRMEGPESVRLEMNGLFGDSNDVAAVIVLALPFALVPAFQKAGHLGRQILGALFAGISILVVWYSQSRGAMLALAVQFLAVGTLKTDGKKGFVTLLLACLLGAGYYAVVKAIPRESEEMHASSEGRITYWKTAVNMTLHRPVFGVGFDQYPENYDRYSVGKKYEWGQRTAHSSWFLAFAESGVLGGILFIAFFVTVLQIAWHNRRKRPDQFYALVGYGVAMTFLSHTYSMYVFLLAGLIMASDTLGEGLSGG